MLRKLLRQRKQIKKLKKANKELIYGLDLAVNIIRHANAGAWENGVTDYSGYLDQGEYFACLMTDECREILEKYSPTK